MGGSDLGWPRHNLKTLFKNNESKKGWGCQVAECLPSKRKALSLNPSTVKRRRRKKRKRRRRRRKKKKENEKKKEAPSMTG
jgi:hypothetical protein